MFRNFLVRQMTVICGAPYPYDGEETDDAAETLADAEAEIDVWEPQNQT